MPTYARYKHNGQYLRGTLWTCSADEVAPPETQADDYALGFGIPAAQIVCEVIVGWNGDPATLPKEDEADAREPLPEEQRPGYIAPEPVPPTPLEIIAKALLADPTTSQPVKDAVQQAIAAGGADGGAAIPMTPQANA